MAAKLSLKRRFFCKIVKIWLSTLRIRREIPPEASKIGVLALWHEDLFAATAAFRGKGFAAFISASADGEFLARIASDLGYRVVRGSSSSKSLGIREMLGLLESGVPCAMALDGPKGPARVEKPGTRWLADKANVPVWKLEARYAARISLATWDRANIPVPFSKVTIKIREM